MSSASHPVWVAHVQGARRGDAAAKEELDSYFTPFVHGVLCCHIAHQVATPMVRAALDEAYARLGELKEAGDFGGWILELARRVAKNVAKKPGATLEMVGSSGSVEGLKVLSRLRAQPEVTRERLMLRLLEGVPGPEIAEVSCATQSEVRSDLERGFATLIKDLTGQTVTVTGDTYLWSLVGTPHEKLVSLENQLTALRYDPGAVEGMTVPLVEANTPQGKRPTSEHTRVAPAKDDDPGTTPIGVKLTDETTGSTGPALPPPPDEQTRHATDLPAAAQENPFEAQPGTIPVSDLPAAAAAASASPGAPPRPSGKRRAPAAEPSTIAPLETLLGDDPQVPTTLRARSGERKAEEPDATAPRGVPLSVLARSNDTNTATPTPTSDPAQSWKIRDSEERTLPPTPPQPFSLTRGTTPFYVAIVLFAVFTFVAWVNIQGTERAVRRGWNLVPVMVATENLSEGTVLTDDLISTRDVPELFVTASVIKPDSTAYVLNQRILVPVQAGDPLLWTQFDAARATERMSKRVQARGRAYTIEARSITSVGGWVRPGDHVDIIISMKDPATKEKVAATTLQNIPVLATGKLTASTNQSLLRESQKEYQTVSVLVLPEEVDMLALMRNRAAYRLVLRNDQDYDPFESGHSSAGTLLEGRRNQALQQKRFETIQMIRRTR